MISAHTPCRTALRRERYFPASVVGPVLFSALRRLASIWRRDVTAASLRYVELVTTTLLARTQITLNSRASLSNSITALLKGLMLALSWREAGCHLTTC